MIVIFGGGDIAQNGIKKVLDCVVVNQSECDVRNPHQVIEVLNMYRPDTVINCAGISHVSSIEDSTVKDWVNEIETNLLGSYYIAKFSIQSGVKNMIFIASVAGLYGKPNHSGYSASKGGVISLVQSLGMEGFNAYAISPGRVDTKMRENDYPGEDPRTRLNPIWIGKIVQRILDNKYNPGDNIIIRKRGFTIYSKVDNGYPWRKYLKVGEPPVV